MDVKIKSMHIENFKGIKNLDIAFGDKVTVKGQNASGKTSIVDAFLWLLFNKNSEYVEKFEVRPLDVNGKQIDYVDIAVSAVIDVDGKETELKKIQKQNWVKHRGSEEAILQGNINSFEIDGYPRSNAEYTKFITDIVDENLFKILTSPTYFPNMKWKEQRDILMKFANTESDFELAKRIGGFDLILDELEKAPSTEDIQKKYGKALKELKSKQVELPIRIDEISKSKTIVDVADLEAQKAVLKAKLEGISIMDTSAIKKSVMDAEFQLSTLTTNANLERNKKSNSLSTDISAIDAEISKARSEAKSADYYVESTTRQIEANKVEIEALGKKYYELAGSKFDESLYVYNESSEYCSLCGQKLPEEKIATAKADFENHKMNAKKIFDDNKAIQMQKYIDAGNELKRKNETFEAEIVKNKQISEMSTNRVTELVGKKNALTTELELVSKSVDLSDNAEYIRLCKVIEDGKKTIADIESNSMSLIMERTTIESNIAIIDESLTKARFNEEIDKRVAGLKDELKEVAQKIADCEHILYLVENFIKEKMNNISATINGHFEGITFTLFKQNLNGSIEETCECSVNGVGYANVNNGHKIVAGLQIIKALSSIYGKNVFVFIDNAESINEFNLPTMDCQMVLLKVADNKELEVTSEG